MDIHLISTIRSTQATSVVALSMVCVVPVIVFLLVVVSVVGVRGVSFFLVVTVIDVRLMCSITLDAVGICTFLSTICVHVFSTLAVRYVNRILSLSFSIVRLLVMFRLVTLLSAEIAQHSIAVSALRVVVVV